MKLLFFVSIGLMFILKLSSFDWREIVKITLFIVVIEGILRKWVLPQASELIYFFKDITLLVAYIKYYSQPNSQLYKQKSFINTMIPICLLWGTFQVFSPRLGSPIVGVFGLKAYFFYIPLMWMLRDMFESQEELYQFIRQYLSGFSVYLFFCFVILIPLLFYNQKKIWSLLTIGELTLIMGTSFMTGSRGLLISMIAFILAYLAYFFSRGFDQSIKSFQKFICVP